MSYSVFPSERDSSQVKKADWLIGLALAALYFVLLACTLDIGFPRDEGFYFSAAEQYSKWYDVLLEDPRSAFKKETVDKYFGYNGEHPAFPKMLFGLSWRLFGDFTSVDEQPEARVWYDGGAPPAEILPWLRESTAMRLPAMLMSSFLILLIHAFGTRWFGRRVGVAAAVLFMFMPHAFWHAHLACFDMPVTAMWFLTAYCFLRAETGGLWWALLTGVAWGLALSTKHNAYFIPPLYLLWWVIAHRHEFGISKNEGQLAIKLPPIPLSFIAFLVISPLVYYALWPRLWHEPIKHLKWYFGFHAHHVMYWAYYWGWLYTKPPYPLGFSFVMSAMTIPGPTVVLSVVGLLGVMGEWIVRLFGRFSSAMERLAAAFPRRQRGVLLFVFLNFFFPFALIANHKVPIFGGTKHWLPGVPFLAILGGLAFEWVLVAVKDLGEMVPGLAGKRVQALLGALVAAAFVVPAMYDTLHGHTNGSTYYNAFFGGYGAMGDHRMEREFWGNTAFSALPWLNENAPTGAKVNFHDTAWDSIRMYWRDGLLRPDIKSFGDPRNADYYLFHWHKEFLEDEESVRQAMGTDVPVHVVAQDGVPLLNVWARRPKPSGTRPARLPLATPPALHMERLPRLLTGQVGGSSAEKEEEP